MPDASTSTPAASQESFKIRKGILGWVLAPADREHHPLLYRLFHLTRAGAPENKDQLSSEDLRAALPYDTLKEILEVIHESSSKAGLRATVCGNLRECPTVVLHSVTDVPRLAPRTIFSGVADKAHHGVADLYPEAAAALQSALESKDAFTTGWFTSKHHSQTARITRYAPGGRLEVTAQVTMDDWNDLAPSLAAEIAAKAQLNLDAVDGGRECFEENLASWAGEAFALGESNSYSTTINLAHNVSYETMLTRLQEQIDICDRELEGIVEVLKEECSARLGIHTEDTSEHPHLGETPREG